MIPGRVDDPALSRWWDAISPLRPKSLWVGTLNLVRIEANVRVLRTEPLDPLYRLLLRAIEAAGPTTLDHLDGALGLGHSPLYRWLNELNTIGLIRTNDHYALTAAGSAALSSGDVSCSRTERRSFTFVINRDGSANYLPWTAAPGPKVPDLAAKAEIGWLTGCIARSTTWKQRRGFPEEIQEVDQTANAIGATAWKRLAVAHGEQPSVAIVLTADAPAHLYGFATGSGNLDPARPALHLSGGWEEPFPELDGTPTHEVRLRRLGRHSNPSPFNARPLPYLGTPSRIPCKPLRTVPYARHPRTWHIRRRSLHRLLCMPHTSRS